MRAAALLVLVGLLAPALARPGIKAAVEKAFYLKIPSCTYCHVSPSGGAPWNPFGRALRAELYGNTDPVAALKALLAKNKDSDGDGYTDLMEVFAGSWPGDPKKHPLVDPAFLARVLKAVGGIDAYKR